MGVNASKEEGGKSVVLRDVDAESIASTSGMSKSEVLLLLLLFFPWLLLFFFFFFSLLLLVQTIPDNSPPLFSSRFITHMKVFQKAMQMG